MRHPFAHALVPTLAACLAATVAAAAPRMPQTEAYDHPLAGAIVDTATGERLSGPAGLVAALSEADIVFLGETHDNPEHHAAQAWLTGALAPAALAFEMIPASAESALARLRARGEPDRDAVEAALDWTARGWPDFAMYAPILEAAPGAAVTGGELSRDSLRATYGADDLAAAGEALIGPAAGRYGLGTALSAEETAAMTAALVASHCDAIPEAVAEGMIGPQRLRDAALADAALRARAYGREGFTVVVAGAGHARKDRGAPVYLVRARNDLTVVSVGMIELRSGAEDWRDYAGPDEFDYLWFTAPAPREDPCAGFAAETDGD